MGNPSWEWQAVNGDEFTKHRTNWKVHPSGTCMGRVFEESIIPGLPPPLKYCFSPIWMIKTLRVQQWWLYKSTHCFNGGWNPRVIA